MIQMIKRWKKVFVFGVLLLNCDRLLHAQEDLSLDDLLNLEVVVTSKNAESILEAPGVVTVHSEADIDRTGYYTLAELANMTPGYSSLLSELGRETLETRGQSAQDKHLILVDGIPVNFARDYRVKVGNELPIMFAKRIEFLRGPASALYGTGAFFGVINVVSKEFTKKGSKFEAVAEYGIEDDKKRYLASYARRNNVGTLSMNVGFLKKDASDTAWYETDKNAENGFRDNTEATFFYAKHTSHKGPFKGLTTGFMLLNQSDGYGHGWNNGGNAYPFSFQRTFSYIPYVKYTRELTANMTLNSYIKFQENTDQGSQSNPDWRGDSPNWWFGYSVNNKDLEYLAEVNYSTDDMGVIFGLNIDRRQHDPNESTLHDMLQTDFPLFSNSMTRTDSIYLQGKKSFGILSGLNLTFGARFDQGATAVAGEDQTFSQVSPRLAIVQKVTDNLAIKLLSGSALKAPGTVEYNHNQEKSWAVAPGKQPSLGAETIQTNELAIVWNPKNVITTLSLFSDETKNRISRIVLDDGTYIDPSTDAGKPDLYTNVDGTIASSGAELSVVGIISDFKIGFNHSTAEAKNDDDTFVAGNPKSKTNLSVTYEQSNTKPITAALVFKSISSYQNGDGSEWDGFSTIDLKAGKHVSKNVKFELALTNIADTEAWYPDGAGSGKNQIPGRNYTIRLKSTF